MELNLEQLKKIRDGIPGIVVIYKVSEDGAAPLVYSENAPAFSGLSEDEYLALYGKDAMAVVAQGDLPDLLDVVAKVLHGDGDREVTYRTLHKTRGLIWTHVCLRLLGTYGGCPVVLGLFTDVTSALKMPQVLLDNTDREIYIVERDTHDLLYANEKAVARAGGGFALGSSCFSYLRGNKGPCDDCIMTLLQNDVLDTGQPVTREWHDTVRDRYFEIRAVPLAFFEKKACALFFNDQTYHIMMEQALKDEHERYLAATEGASLRVYEYDIASHHIHLPAYSAALFGTPEDVDDIPDSALSLFWEEDWQRVREFFSRVDAGEPRVTGEFLMKPVNGNAARLRYTFTTIFDDGGRPTKAYAVAEDVTAVRQAELRYQRAISEMIDANPKTLCVFELNLTRNTCSTGHGTSEFIQNALASQTVDGVFSNLEALVTDADDLVRCRKLLDRTYLIKQLDQGHERLSVEYRRASENGTPVWVATFLSMARNPSTGDAEAVIYSEDIDERKHDEEALQIVTRTGYDFIAFVDPAKGVLEFREISAQIPNRFHDDFHGKGIFRDYNVVLHHSARMWIHPDDWELFLRKSKLTTVVRELDGKGRYEFSIRGLRGDRILRKQLQYAYLEADKHLIVVWQMDVTDTFMREQEDARRLQEALDEAKRANTAKSDFLGTVSHDMRTPLNGIMSFTEFALSENDETRKQGYLEKIRTSAAILKQLVDDTLDLSKIESGKYTLKPGVWNSHRLLEEVDISIRAAAEAKGVRFEEDWSNARDGFVFIDRLAEQKIFLNLLSNAVKFTPEGGIVRLIVEDLDPLVDGCNAVLTVSDSGIGMSSDFLPKAFEPFTQEHAGGSGTGLGLSIAQRLVELMGGRIEVRSEVGQGTTFHVYLPMTWVDEDTAADAAANAGTAADAAVSIGTAADVALLKGRRALLTEDNEMNMEIAMILLERCGMKVTCASNGKEGVEAFIASGVGTYDVILMDIRMPVMDGYAAARAIRQLDRPDATSVPIIAMTADAYIDDVKRALDAGMNAHLSKPIDFDQFIHTIAGVLS